MLTVPGSLAVKRLEAAMPRLYCLRRARLSSICVAFSLKKSRRNFNLRRNFTVKVEILNSTYILFSNCITTAQEGRS